MTDTATNADALLRAIEDVLEDHDVYVGMPKALFLSLRTDLSEVISKTLAPKKDNGFGMEIPGLDPALVTVCDPIPLSPETKKRLDEIDQAQAAAMNALSNIRAGDGAGLIEHPATFTHDGAHGHAYYFAPTPPAPPPYLKQVHVDAIVDLAADGTLAGVELIIDDIPPPAFVNQENSLVAQTGAGPGSVTADQHVAVNSPATSFNRENGVHG